MESDFITIIFLMGLIAVCILGIKYINGDFSPISIEKMDEYGVTQNNENVIGKKVSIIYKYTYTDGRVKYKTKTIKL